MSNHKKPNNYILQNINKNGENFIQQMNTMQLKQDSLRVFRDLARGKIDPENEGKLLLNDNFLEAAIQMAEEKYRNEQISRDGVSILIYTYGNNVDDSVRARLDDHVKAVEAYKCILDLLYALKTTGDIAYFYSGINAIRPFRNYI